MSNHAIAKAYVRFNMDDAQLKDEANSASLKDFETRFSAYLNGADEKHTQNLEEKAANKIMADLSAQTQNTVGEYGFVSFALDPNKNLREEAKKMGANYVGVVNEAEKLAEKTYLLYRLYASAEPQKKPGNAFIAKRQPPAPSEVSYAKNHNLMEEDKRVREQTAKLIAAYRAARKEHEDKGGKSEKEFAQEEKKLKALLAEIEQKQKEYDFKVGGSGLT